MPKKRTTGAIQAPSKTDHELFKSVNQSTQVQPQLSDDSFKGLKEKISAQLSNVSQQRQKVSGARSTAVIDGKDGPRGKKRAADGTFKSKSPTSNGVAEKNTTPDDNDSDKELKAALKELGGTEEDLDLMAGAASESELEGVDGEVAVKQEPKKKASSLQDGMANILKEIALAQGFGQEDTSSSEEESAREVDLDSEEEGGDSQPQPAKVEKTTSRIDVNLSDKTVSKKRSGDNRFKCQPRADWFNLHMPEIDPDTASTAPPAVAAIDGLHTHAKALLVTENDTFRSAQQSSSSQAFYNTVIASGTISDKISALTLAVQESPLHNIKALENLIGLAKKRARGQSVDVLRALKDLFAQGTLLPGDRRLYTFATQPDLISMLGKTKSWRVGDNLPRGLEESHLINWAYEDWLKQQYFEILKILEVWCNDEIEFSKGRAVSYVYELLKEKPEQESNLLRLLINKLGDRVKKISSQTSYLLMQLLSAHPAMKMVVVSAIETDFIFRPGQSMHAKYYAVVTLNQTALSTREEEVAEKLLAIYFGLFTTLLKPSSRESDVSNTVNSKSRAQRQRKSSAKVVENSQEDELREKLISAVLTGVNRAYPYVGTDQKNFTDHLDTLFRITHSANFNTSVQALLLIQQLTSTHSASADRFYRTLYESLLDPRLVAASKQQLYLNLLHRSLTADTNTRRVKAFVKRLLQVLSLHEAPFICGVFFLLQDLEKTYPSLAALVDNAEDHDDGEESFRDVDEDAKTADTVAQKVNAANVAYDGYKRAPEHANADNSCAWEVLPFLAHFHPSVTISADHYMMHSKLPGKPDLSLHTLIHFLDRFVYRNPKLASNKLRGSSLMQPMASDDSHAVLISSTSRQTQPAVNTDEFRSQKGEDIAAEDVFFHKYFTTLGKDTKVKKRKDREADDDGSVGDAGEDAVWKAMIDSAPDLEGEGSEDEDLDMSDYDELEQDSEDGFSESGEVDLGFDEDEEDEVDIEAGIFDDSDEDMVDAADGADDLQQSTDSDFEGLDSDAAGESVQAKKKKKKEKRQAEKEKRRKMKGLPTFASAADYAKMLDSDDDEDMG